MIEFIVALPFAIWLILYIIGIYLFVKADGPMTTAVKKDIEKAKAKNEE
jgi:hypothetical protein